MQHPAFTKRGSAGAAAPAVRARIHRPGRRNRRLGVSARAERGTAPDVAPDAFGAGVRNSAATTRCSSVPARPTANNSGERRRRESNPRTGLCRPLPEPLGYAAGRPSPTLGSHWVSSHSVLSAGCSVVRSSRLGRLVVMARHVRSAVVVLRAVVTRKSPHFVSSQRTDIAANL